MVWEAWRRGLPGRLDKEAGNDEARCHGFPETWRWPWHRPPRPRLCRPPSWRDDQVPPHPTHPNPELPLTPPQRVAYVYKAKREINGSRVRVIWGRISRPHGNSGVAKAKFATNLPAKVFGASVRIMLFPSTI